MQPTLLSLLLLAARAGAVLDVDFSSPASIKAGARAALDNLMTYYKGNLTGGTPGILPGPPPNGDYYWWEGGAMWGTIVDYWHYTGDTSYNGVTSESLTFQSGPPANAYMPLNWTASLGNDDQGFWGMSALLAAEVTFPNPPKDQPQWLALAQAVFNTQAGVDRHDNSCGGGLRWQIPLSNNGYNYKNSIANGIFFNMGARLGRYTENQTYFDWAVKTWDWMEAIGFMTPGFDVYDGAHTDTNCTDIAKPQFTYNAGVFMQGAAFMYNYTKSDVWKSRVQGLVDRTIKVFFADGIPIEISCELPDRVQCKTDMLSFKGFLLRWMASTAQLAPFTHDTIMPVLKTAAQAAVKSCNGPVCGFRWNTGASDNLLGAGQQMNVVAALSSLLLDQPTTIAPVTAKNGGISTGDVNAGNGAGTPTVFGPITTADRAGAGILTAMTIAGLGGTIYWLSSGLSEGGSRKW